MTSSNYIKQDPITHILTRPDMYVGSKTFEQQSDYIWKNNKIVKKDIKICPALTRTFIEILSNAIDNIERSKDTNKMTYIKVHLSQTECEIINDGSIIPIIVNDKEKIYNHTLIFGHLLSGSNYNDSEKRYTSGRNGLGAKLTNVLSKSFSVEGVDPERKLKFEQTWTNNMRETTGPKITKTSRSARYTSIKWSWDCNWFKAGMKLIPENIIDLFGLYVLNASMLTELNVQLNGSKLPNKLIKYFDLFDDETTTILKLENEHSKVFITFSPIDEFETISFVNGIQTKNGGKHVNAWVEAVCRPIVEKLKTKVPGITLKDVKPYFRFLIITRIANPEFEGQEKNELKAPNIDAQLITSSQVSKIMKSIIGKKLDALIQIKDDKILAKAVSTNTFLDIKGYNKANNAGVKKGNECILIVCEGDSAKTFAMEGINSNGFNNKVGRDWFGIYPLRGKLLNTRNATSTSISKNKVITNLIKILGLDCTNPNNIEKLNYGKMCILTDADVDGIHIEGLLLNFFHSMFPRLLEINFVISMKTPILRVSISNKKEPIYFFDEKTYRNFDLPKNSQTKYFKGLGTNKTEDIKKVFGIKILQFTIDDNTNNFFNIAFNKTETIERKKWLEEYSPLDESKKTLDEESSQTVQFPISRHLNEELIKFFHDDCKRSIPSVFDGLKESQRKIVYAAKKRKIEKELKIAQFGAYVAEHTNYHHGEENLFKTIIKMAQNFVGSNNLPLFSEDGQFGTRLQGGEDAAKPRYICTQPQPVFYSLFNSEDDNLLTYQENDGDKIEPFHYITTIPMLLVNGCIGIGTGWMCNVPQFRPQDIIKASEFWMNNEHKKLQLFLNAIKPWYNNFTGSVEKISDTKFQTNGIYNQTRNTIKITELPIGVWSSNFEEDLNKMQFKKYIKSLKSNTTPQIVCFEFETTETFDIEIFKKKMCTFLNLDNIVVFDKIQKIKRVNLKEVFDLWGEEKLNLIENRKQFQLTNLKKMLQLTTYKYKFIEAIKNKIIILTEDEDIIVNKIKEIIPDINTENINTLLDLKIRTLTSQKMNQLREYKIKLKQEETNLLKKTSRDIWTEDLQTLKNIIEKNTKEKNLLSDATTKTPPRRLILKNPPNKK
jgi:DNA topoisomerase-2